MKYTFLILLISISNYTWSACPSVAPCIEIDSIHEHNFSPKVKEELIVEFPDESLDLLSFARGYIGTPYLYGGEGENGIDCSAFVQQVFREVGISLPRTSREQFQDPKLFKIDEDHLAPNDLLFFKNENGDEIDHVAIYIGDGKMIHSSRSENGVQITDFKFSAFWSKRYYAARRVIK